VESFVAIAAQYGIRLSKEKFVESTVEQKNKSLKVLFYHLDNTEIYDALVFEKLLKQRKAAWVKQSQISKPEFKTINRFSRLISQYLRSADLGKKKATVAQEPAKKNVEAAKCFDSIVDILRNFKPSTPASLDTSADSINQFDTKKKPVFAATPITCAAQNVKKQGNMDQLFVKFFKIDSNASSTKSESSENEDAELELGVFEKNLDDILKQFSWMN